MPDLYNLEVSSRKSFIEFLELFHQDFLNKEDEWENPTLARFLEAMIAYTRDIQFAYINNGQTTNADIASWKVFADILKGAKIYE